MGGAKREMMRLEEARANAGEIGVRVGLLTRCSTCGELKDPGSCNFEDAYKLGNHLMTRGDTLTEEFESRTEMTDLIKEVAESAPDQCHCDYVLAKDD